MNFQSDNQSSIFPEIIKYLEEINLNSSPAYGSDKITIQANEMLSELFKIDLKILIRDFHNQINLEKTKLSHAAGSELKCGKCRKM